MATYLDFGMSFGTSIWPYIKYGDTNEIQNQPGGPLDTYLNSLYQQLKANGMGRLYIAFAQLQNICYYSSPPFPDVSKLSGDPVAQLLSQFQDDQITTPSYADFLQYLIAKAQENGVEVALSWGGADATFASGTLKILQGDWTYTDAADHLATYVNQWKIDWIDFDIEDPAFNQQPLDSKGNDYTQFFRELQVKNIKTSLTLPASVSWANDTLKSLFFDSQGKPIFHTLFNGLNVMNYDDGTSYYLDAKTVNGWGMVDWIDAVGRENANLIHIGFQDKTPYQDPSAYAGGTSPYTIASGSSPGSAAAQIYAQLLKNIAALNYPTNFGAPYWWADQSVTGMDGVNRYSIEGNESHFVSQPQHDFSY